MRFGAFSLYMPELLLAPAQSFARAFAQLAAPDWRPRSAAPTLLPDPAPPAPAMAAWGLRAVASLAVPVEGLERLDALIRAAPRRAGAALLDPAALQGLGWLADEAETILRGLGSTPARKPAAGQATPWRRRQAKPAAAHAQPTGASPFAALAGLAATPTTPPGAIRPPRRRGPRRRAS